MTDEPRLTGREQKSKQLFGHINATWKEIEAEAARIDALTHDPDDDTTHGVDWFKDA